jgi:hypothetical protein
MNALSSNVLLQQVLPTPCPVAGGPRRLQIVCHVGLSDNLRSALPATPENDDLEIGARQARALWLWRGG